MKKDTLVNVLTGGIVGGLCVWAIWVITDDIAPRIQEHSFMKKKVKENWNRMSRETKDYFITIWYLYDGDIDKMAYHIRKDFLRIKMDDYLNNVHATFDMSSVIRKTTVVKYLKCMKPYIKKEAKVMFKK